MNNIVEFIMNEWCIIFALIAVTVTACISAYRYFGMPTEEQLDKVREWLLWAVTEAEKELGSGTGQLKLRQVYDMFVVRFAWIAKAISFSMFSDLVDEALIEMRKMLETNVAVQAHVGIKEAE